ncbi:MAG: HAD family hydrolase [Silicimonas sp.]|nr:HAD family hydrolase [Silicimonas sp.]
MKIAMWSGPRNLSTAMMYSFGNRPDFEAWDEPFYAAYLKATGIDHPMRDDVLKAHETDPEAVANKIKSASGNLYMKHMGFQMEPDFPMDWAKDCVNIHLIRHPSRVVASYAAKRENPTLRDIGFEQQVEVYERFPGPVIDSADVRRDPEGMLRKLCAEIGLGFDPAMLSWPAGPKDFDGAWAPHWYNAVHRSTGFAGAEGPLPDCTNDLVAKAMPYYRTLETHRLSL